MNEAFEDILAEWRNGGLTACLAGEEIPSYVLPSSRIIGWKETEWRRPWTAEEDVIMRKYYLIKGYTGLLSLLPLRSKDSIKSRARNLGVQAQRCGSRRRTSLA